MSSTPLHKANQLKDLLQLAADLYLKREDLHPLGSHKGRSIPIMLGFYLKQGKNNFVISSSGNAALAAQRYISEYNKNNSKKITLKIFVGQKISEKKLTALRTMADDYITLVQVDKPKQSAFRADKDGEAKNLRQSTDDLALIGYAELAKELAAIKNLSAIFIPTSSGTTAVGLHQGFIKEKINPQIHIVQTTAIYPLVKSVADTGGQNNLATITPTKSSLAGAIVDQVAQRQTQIVEIIKESAGGAWVADDENILEAMKQVAETEKIDISANSALSVAGLKLALQSGIKFGGSIVCLITGK